MNDATQAIRSAVERHRSAVEAQRAAAADASKAHDDTLRGQMPTIPPAPITDVPPTTQEEP